MKKNPNKNKRAFTLTELLIVVIVIGVLSAVTLPKFNRVIENRKVTEAEEMMSAVRTEQERRCAMDKKYTLEFDNLADVISSSDTKDYKYSLQTEGISATSNKGNYTLKMLSYQDGSFCCTGDDCAKLNKNYPSCDGLTFPSSGCEGSDGDGSGVGTDPTPTPEPMPAPEPSCEGSQPADQVKACACGTVKASYSCSAATNYKWVLGAFPACPAKPADENDICPNGTVRTKSYACVNGTWTAGNWDKECSRCNESARLNCKDKEQLLNTGGGMGSLKSVHYVWNEANCSCSCPSSANAGLCSTGWDPNTCNCKQGPKYYFKCVTRVTTNGSVPYGGASSFAEAKTACEQGTDTSVEYYKYLTGGKPAAGCRPSKDKNGKLTDCALTPAYYIKYVCSTEPAKKNDGYGFDEVTCMVRQPHEDRRY